MNVYILFWNGGFKAFAFVISSHKSKVSTAVFQQSYFLISWGSVTSEIHGFFMVALSNVWAGNMTEYMRLRINDAHHMFWIFSSWCVKGELGLRDSRLGTSPEGEEAERQKGIERLIWYSSYVLCPSLAWTVSGGGWGWEWYTWANTHTDAHRSLTCMNTISGLEVQEIGRCRCLCCDITHLWFPELYGIRWVSLGPKLQYCDRHLCE